MLSCCFLEFLKPPLIKRIRCVDFFVLSVTIFNFLEVGFFVTLLVLGGCQKWGDPDGVNCYQPNDPELSWFYNALPVKGCDSNPAELQRKIDEWESKDYDCKQIHNLK